MIKLPRRPSTTWTHGRRLQSPTIRYQMGSGVSARLIGIRRRIWKRIWRNHNPNWGPTL